MLAGRRPEAGGRRPEAVSRKPEPYALSPTPYALRSRPMPANPPAWVKDAVFYQIFPDRFARSLDVSKPTNLEDWNAPPTLNGYKGGDLVGISDKLDWLQDLGINAIYLNPIFMSGSNHRYHTVDYYRIDPLLGSDEDFEHLQRACHARGIRIVIDGVFNHASRGFFQFHDILENGPHSPWIDWFNIKEFPLNAYNGEAPGYEAWWGMPALPEFNTENPHVREYLMQVAEHWARRGIDGWRLDVPNEITTEGFWEEFRKRTKAINPDLYIVGEIWDDATWWIEDGTRFDGVMNYPLAGSTLAFCGGPRIDKKIAKDLPYQVGPPLDAQGYGDAVDALLASYPWEATCANLNLLGSHDVPRILSLAGGDTATVVLSVLLQMTFPGAPSVYYGDEIGLAGGKDPDNRRGFPWSDESVWDLDILAAHRELVALRATCPALRRGSYRRLQTDSVAIHAFERRTDDDHLIIAVNCWDDARAVDVPEVVGSDFDVLYGTGGLAVDNDETRIALAPREGAIWRVLS